MTTPASLVRAIANGDPLVRAAEVVRVIDGDTFVARLTLWPDPPLAQEWHVRVLGCNAPEEGEGGHDEARAALDATLNRGAVHVQGIHLDKWRGRIDAVVVVDDVAAGALLVADELIRLRVAVPWDGVGPKPHVPWPPPLG